MLLSTQLLISTVLHMKHNIKPTHQNLLRMCTKWNQSMYYLKSPYMAMYETQYKTNTAKLTTNVHQMESVHVLLEVSLYGNV